MTKLEEKKEETRTIGNCRVAWRNYGIIDMVQRNAFMLGISRKQVIPKTDCLLQFAAS